MSKNRDDEPEDPCAGLGFEVQGPPPLDGVDPDEVLWMDEVPVLLEPAFVPVVRPDAQGCIRGVTVGQRVYAVWTHYVIGVGSLPHVGSVARCPYCQQGNRVRLKGYLAVLHWPKQTMAIFELTQDVLRAAPEIVKPTAAIRGRGIMLERTGKGKRCRVHMTLSPREKTPLDLLRTLPADIDVKEAMCRIWGLRSPQSQPPLDDPSEIL